VMTIARLLFAPAILSAYTTYGLISALRIAGKNSFGNCFAGASAGFMYGSYYIFTGDKLDRALFGDRND